MFYPFDTNSSEYRAVHYRLKVVKGKESQHKCFNCGGPAREWSWTHNADPGQLKSYKPMCHGCHMTYDRVWNPVEPQEINGFRLPRGWEEVDGIISRIQ